MASAAHSTTTLVSSAARSAVPVLAAMPLVASLVHRERAAGEPQPTRAA